MNRKRDLALAAGAVALAIAAVLPTAAAGSATTAVVGKGRVAKGVAASTARPAAAKRVVTKTRVVVAKKAVVAAPAAAVSVHNKIALVLRQRNVRFDAAASRLGAWIGQTGAIAAQIQGAGGDASTAQALLSSASEHLANAKTIEQQAVAAFARVPAAANRMRAFWAARALGRQLVIELTQAKSDLQAAVAELRAQLGLLHASASSKATSGAANAD